MSSPTKIRHGKIGIETKMLLEINLNQSSSVKLSTKSTNSKLSNCKKDETKSSIAVEEIICIPCRLSKYDNVDESSNPYRTDVISWALKLMKPMHN